MYSKWRRDDTYSSSARKGGAMSDISCVLSSARWADESFYLKEFLHKFKLPQVVKVDIIIFF